MDLDSDVKSSSKASTPNRNHEHEKLYADNQGFYSLNQGLLTAKQFDLSGHRQDLSWEELSLVKSLIELCMKQQIRRAEIYSLLERKASIDPGITNMVWQKLEEQNPDFFWAYDVSIKVRDQIIAFNFLFDQHTKLIKLSQPKATQSNTPSMNPEESTSSETVFDTTETNFLKVGKTKLTINTNESEPELGLPSQISPLLSLQSNLGERDLTIDRHFFTVSPVPSPKENTRKIPMPTL